MSNRPRKPPHTKWRGPALPKGYKPGRLVYFLMVEFPDSEYTGNEVGEYVKPCGTRGIGDVVGEMRPCFSMDTSPV